MPTWLSDAAARAAALLGISRSEFFELAIREGLKPEAGRGEWKVVAVRETAPTKSRCDLPSLAADYWQECIATAPQFSPEVETLAVLVLNTRHCVRGHYIVSTGTINECIAHARETFRAAIVGGAYAVILMHNHPSGDPSPSGADRRLTRRMRAAADLLQIGLLDHVIVGARDRYFSFAEAGFAAASS